jgi:hypothetical protein
VPAIDPAGLSPSRVAVGTHPGFAECLRELRAQQRDRPVGLRLPGELCLRGVNRVQRRLDVGHVQHGSPAPRKVEGEPAAPQQPVVAASGGDTGVHLSGVGLVVLVHVLDDDLL